MSDAAAETPTALDSAEDAEVDRIVRLWIESATTQSAGDAEIQIRRRLLSDATAAARDRERFKKPPTWAEMLEMAAQISTYMALDARIAAKATHDLRIEVERLHNFMVVIETRLAAMEPKRRGRRGGGHVEKSEPADAGTGG